MLGRQWQRTSHPLCRASSEQRSGKAYVVISLWVCSSRFRDISEWPA